MEKIKALEIDNTNFEDSVSITCCQEYEIVVENGSIKARRKNLTPPAEYNMDKYPKNYDEACDILGDKKNDFNLNAYWKLIYIRNAYWKLYNNWKPDWASEHNKFVIATWKGQIELNQMIYKHCILAFPTKEMRNHFYDNHLDLIRQCKDYI